MIARIWKGETPAMKADEYFAYIKKTGVAGLLDTPGNRGVYVFRQLEGDQAHFLMLSLWDSLEAIKKFTGDDYQKARLYPDDQKYLSRFETDVSHFEMLLYHPKED